VGFSAGFGVGELGDSGPGDRGESLSHAVDVVDQAAHGARTRARELIVGHARQYVDHPSASRFQVDQWTLLG